MKFIVLLLLASCSSSPKYKVGDCITDDKYSGSIAKVNKISETEYKLCVRQFILWVEQDQVCAWKGFVFVDKQSVKTECEK